MKNINACRQRFMVEAVTLFLSIKGRINFQQLERYGKYSEQRYRIQFEKPFDFMAFNSELVQQHGSGHYLIALDPSFIAKSGKKTPGIGYFWSGQAAKTERGLELLGLADIDVDNRTGFHPDACQTLSDNHPGKSLVGIYADSFTNHGKQLLELSSIAVADTWFTKNSFIDALCDAGFQLVGRTRDDANLKYQRGSISMADIKTMNHNALLMNRFFSTFGVNPHLKKPAQASSIPIKDK